MREVLYTEPVNVTVESDILELPMWLEPILCSFGDLMALPPDWDSYGGRPIAHGAVDRALDLLASIMEDSTPVPSIVPIPDGGVQMEWHLAGVDLEITLHGAGGGEVSFEDRANSSWEGELPASLPRLRPIVRRLSQ